MLILLHAAFATSCYALRSCVACERLGVIFVVTVYGGGGGICVNGGRLVGTLYSCNIKHMKTIYLKQK